MKMECSYRIRSQDMSVKTKTFGSQCWILSSFAFNINFIQIKSYNVIKTNSYIQKHLEVNVGYFLASHST